MANWLRLLGGLTLVLGLGFAGYVVWRGVLPIARADPITSALLREAAGANLMAALLIAFGSIVSATILLALAHILERLAEMKPAPGERVALDRTSGRPRLSRE